MQITVTLICLLGTNLALLKVCLTYAHKPDFQHQLSTGFWLVFFLSSSCFHLPTIFCSQGCLEQHYNFHCCSGTQGEKIIYSHLFLPKQPNNAQVPFGGMFHTGAWDMAYFSVLCLIWYLVSENVLLVSNLLKPLMYNSISSGFFTSLGI